MTLRTATVAVALTVTAGGCGSSSPTSPSAPSATSLPPAASSNEAASPQAQPAAVQVSLLSVVPGTPSGDGDWCIGADPVVLTAHVVDTAQSEVTAGRLEWHTCGGPQGGLPKEDCDAPGPGRWVPSQWSDLSIDATPSTYSNPGVPVLGYRLLYRPAQGSGLRRATSESFNLDLTCPL
jgi:hypothetical protein